MQHRIEQPHKLQQRGSEVAICYVTRNGQRYNYDPLDPHLVLSALNNSREFPRGQVIYLPILADSQQNIPEQQTCVMTLVDGTCTGMLFPFWKRDQHFASVAGLIRKFGKDLELDAHMEGRRLCFTSNGSLINQNQAINRLIEAHMLSTIPTELRAPHSRTNLGNPVRAWAESDRGVLYLVDTAAKLEELVNAWLGANPPEQWLGNWQDSFFNKGLTVCLELDCSRRDTSQTGPALWLYHVGGKFVIGAAEGCKAFEGLRAEPDRFDPAACAYAATSLPIDLGSGPAVIDFGGALHGTWLDSNKATFQAAGDPSRSLPIIFDGDHGRYSVKFEITKDESVRHIGPKDFSYQLSDKRLIIPALPGPAPALTISVRPCEVTRRDGEVKITDMLAITREQCAEMLKFCDKIAMAMFNWHSSATK